jgi:ATP-dependent Lhr-like helicase
VHSVDVVTPHDIEDHLDDVFARGDFTRVEPKLRPVMAHPLWMNLADVVCGNRIRRIGQRAKWIEPGMQFKTARMRFIYRKLQRIIQWFRRLAHLPGQKRRPRFPFRRVECVALRPDLENNRVELQFRRTVQNGPQLRLLLRRGQTRLRRPVQVVNRRHPRTAKLAHEVRGNFRRTRDRGNRQEEKTRAAQVRQGRTNETEQRCAFFFRLLAELDHGALTVGKTRRISTLMPVPSSAVFTWFRRKYGKPTPAQSAAWPLLERGANVLLASPTGTGKTFAAFLSVLDALVAEDLRGTLRDRIYCVYVSPLRALSYDLEKNLNGPLKELFRRRKNPPIRVALRTGDTTAHQRARQFVKPPHILLTTPESLCVLLSQEKWLSHLAGVRWMIVDEIHALADNKRGAHLTLSIERLAALVEAGVTRVDSALPERETPLLQRIGLSATIAPLPEIAQFLVGTHGHCEIVDVSTSKKVELRVYTPLRKNPYPEAGYTGERLIHELGLLIKKNRTTLIFSNIRSGAEATTYWLRENFPELADKIECHHASLERDIRREVEDRLKRGELRAVVCSTSLELGIDIGSVDLVVMLSTPKGVSKALQRAGRAGHNIHVTSRGVLMATNVSDLVEACATVLLARKRHLDEVRIPRAPLDVLAQHLVSMGCTADWLRSAAFALIRRAYPFREVDQAEFDDVLEYLAGGGESLRRRYSEVFGKIELDAERFRTREGRVRRDFLQNIGVIPNVGVVRVRMRARLLGSVEESFIRQIKIGDVFMIAGRPVRLDKVTTMEAWVTAAPGQLPTVPRWNANKMPLTNRVAREIVAFRRELRKRLENEDLPDGHSERSVTQSKNPGDGDAPGRVNDQAAEFQGASLGTGRGISCGAHMLPRPPSRGLGSSTPLADARYAQNDRAYESVIGWIARRLDCGRANAGIIWKMHLAQHRLSEIPTDDFLLVEELVETPEKTASARHYFFHSLIGRAANDALARVVTYRLSQLRGGNAIATPHDYGFVLTVAGRQCFHENELPELLRLRGFDGELQASLAQSEMLKYHFRNAAQTGLMVYRNYFDQIKPMRKLAWSAEVIFNVLREHEPDHVLMREARRDTLRTFLDADGARAYLAAQADRPVRLRQVGCVPPLSFAMYATKIKEALLVEDPYETMERLYHQWWSRIEHDRSVATGI